MSLIEDVLITVNIARRMTRHVVNVRGPCGRRTFPRNPCSSTAAAEVSLVKEMLIAVNVARGVTGHVVDIRGPTGRRALSSNSGPGVTTTAHVNLVQTLLVIIWTARLVMAARALDLLALLVDPGTDAGSAAELHIKCLLKKLGASWKTEGVAVRDDGAGLSGFGSNEGWGTTSHLDVKSILFESWCEALQLIPNVIIVDLRMTCTLELHSDSGPATHQDIQLLLLMSRSHAFQFVPDMVIIHLGVARTLELHPDAGTTPHQDIQLLLPMSRSHAFQFVPDMVIVDLRMARTLELHPNPRATAHPHI
jgi:hypothetical protein